MGRLRGGLVGPSHSPARSAPWREVPPLRSGAPRHAPVGQFGAHVVPVKEAPSSAWTQMPRVLNSPSTAAPTAMQPLRAGRPGGRAGPWTRIAPGVDHGVERLQRPARAALWTAPGPHRVGDFRGPSRPRSEAAPIVDARRWPIRAPSCPGVQADDHRIQTARAGAVPLPYPPRRRASPPGTVGGHRSRRAPPPRSTVLAALPLPRVGTRRRSRPGPSRSPGDRSAQRPARVPGPLFEQSGEQAISPSDHRPRPNRSARTSRPTPHRNATAPPHPRPPTRAITSSVITYRSFQIKGTHRQMNTPTGRAPR